MSITASLYHLTHHKYDEPVTLSPQIVRLRPAPHSGTRVANDHIAVARGRDYGDVAPVKGVLRTSRAQSTKQSVDVVPVEGSQ